MNRNMLKKKIETPEERVERLSSLPEIKVLLEIAKKSCIETYEHSFSVALMVAKMLPLLSDYTYEEQEEIIKGALLHDVGKIFLPFNLTQVPRSITNQEYDIVKIHTAISYEIVTPIFSQIVQNICLYHHERPNGSGYTKSKNLSNIPTEALVVQVADIFDALTSERVYKKKYTPQSAIEEMRKEARRFAIDDGYLKALETVIAEYIQEENQK